MSPSGSSAAQPAADGLPSAALPFTALVLPRANSASGRANNASPRTRSQRGSMACEHSTQCQAVSGSVRKDVYRQAPGDRKICVCARGAGRFPAARPKHATRPRRRRCITCDYKGCSPKFTSPSPAEAAVRQPSLAPGHCGSYWAGGARGVLRAGCRHGMVSGVRLWLCGAVGELA